MKVAYLSVEYVASGPGHLDRLPCYIRLLQQGAKQSKPVLIHWQHRMVSPLTEISRLTTDLIDAHGIPSETAFAMVRSELSPDTVLVGVNMKRHVHALQLCKNVHYLSYIDLTSMLKLKHANRWHFLPLATMATVLGMKPTGTAPPDELEMVRFLHSKCASSQSHMEAIRQLTAHITSQPRPAHDDASHVYRIDGVCTSAYNAQRCSCNQMSLNPHPSNQRRPTKAITADP